MARNHEKRGTPINYGETIQLMHAKSGKFLKLVRMLTCRPSPGLLGLIPGSWLRYALGESSGAIEGPITKVRGAAVRPIQWPSTLRLVPKYRAHG